MWSVTGRSVSSDTFSSLLDGVKQSWISHRILYSDLLCKRGCLWAFGGTAAPCLRVSAGASEKVRGGDVKKVSVYLRQILDILTFIC